MAPQCDHGSQETVGGQEEEPGESQPEVADNSDGDRISNPTSGSCEFECCSASPLPDIACNDDDLGGQGFRSGRLGVCYSDSDTDDDPDRGWGPYKSDPVWETDHLRPEAGELQEEVAGRSLAELAALLHAAGSTDGTRGGRSTQLDAEPMDASGSNDEVQTACFSGDVHPQVLEADAQQARYRPARGIGSHLGRWQWREVRHYW